MPGSSEARNDGPRHAAAWRGPRDHLDVCSVSDSYIRKGANWNDLPIPDKRGRAVYRVEVEKPGRDGAAVLRHVFRVDESIPVFAEDADWLGARLRGS